jgi:hypothetical protein
LDAVVAGAAEEMCIERGLDPKKMIHSWVSQKPPSHDKGEITRSRVDDWGHVPLGYDFPEPVREGDAVVIIGGWSGTHYAASWARLANKPIVPVATFGHAAAKIFPDELDNFARRYASRISRDDYEILNRVMPPSPTQSWIDSFAKDVVSLAEKLISSRDVFIIMSSNVYYELGFAQALEKGVITTAYEGTQLPFDIFDVPTLHWNSQRKLGEELDKRIKSVRKS